MSGSTSTRAKRLRLGFTLLHLAIVVAFLAVVGIVLGFAARDARRSAADSASIGRTQQLLYALAEYHDEYGQLPPAYLTDDDGTPMHSWRVLLLPFIGVGNLDSLYREYDFDEPWNGPNNIKPADQMPERYRIYTEPESTPHTNLVLFVGPGTAFPGATTTGFADFNDGLEDTIVGTEVSNSDICWLEPRDLDVTTMSFRANDPDTPGPSSAPWRQPVLIFGDGHSGYTLEDTLPPESLRALTTIAGDEPVTREQLIAEGHLK